MTGQDYLWCAVNLLLDEEEALAALCPTCRAQAETAGCPVCGAVADSQERAENAAFDRARFELLRREAEG